MWLEIEKLVRDRAEELAKELTKKEKYQMALKMKKEHLDIKTIENITGMERM